MLSNVILKYSGSLSTHTHKRRHQLSVTLHTGVKANNSEVTLINVGIS